jgi:hypothetical protein
VYDEDGRRCQRALLILYVQPFARETHVTCHDTSEWLRHDATYRPALSALLQETDCREKDMGEPEWINVMILHLDFCSATFIPLSQSSAPRDYLEDQIFQQSLCCFSRTREYMYSSTKCSLVRRKSSVVAKDPSSGEADRRFHVHVRFCT